MSKDIEKCSQCLEDYCTSCAAYANTCKECGESTCGEEPCLAVCIIKNGCSDLICKTCKKTHDCMDDENNPFNTINS